MGSRRKTRPAQAQAISDDAVIVGCTHAGGIILYLDDWVDLAEPELVPGPPPKHVTKRARRRIPVEQVTLNGPAHDETHGYTSVSQEFWEDWLAHNKDSVLLRDQVICPQPIKPRKQRKRTTASEPPLLVVTRLITGIDQPPQQSVERLRNAIVHLHAAGAEQPPAPTDYARGIKLLRQDHERSLEEYAYASPMRFRLLREARRLTAADPVIQQIGITIGLAEREAAFCYLDAGDAVIEMMGRLHALTLGWIPFLRMMEKRVPPRPGEKRPEVKISGKPLKLICAAVVKVLWTEARNQPPPHNNHDALKSCDGLWELIHGRNLPNSTSRPRPLWVSYLRKAKADAQALAIAEGLLGNWP